MDRNKPIIITAVVTFIVTTVFYLTPLGERLYYSVKDPGYGNTDYNSKIMIIDDLLENYYINEYDKQQMEDYALMGYTAGVGDPYTTYITKDNFEAFMQNMGGDYRGIGVTVINAEDGSMEIMSVIDNSPAKRAGIQVGDRVIKVEGEDVTAENYMQKINVIKGVGSPEDDDDVVITVKRDNNIFDLTIEREELYISTVSSKMLAGGIGYIQITDFGEHTYDEFSDALRKFEGNGTNGIIIDLRNNPGGMLTSVVAIADRLLPVGNILTIREKSGQEMKYDSNESCVDMPICVIVNGQSASASEVLTGALKDHGRAVVVGEKTYGKGVVQSIYEFGDGSAFKYTSSRYYTPSGECIDGVGIAPDVTVSLDEQWQNTAISLIPENEDIQLNVAIDELSKLIK